MKFKLLAVTGLALFYQNAYTQIDSTATYAKTTHVAQGNTAEVMEGFVVDGIGLNADTGVDRKSSSLPAHFVSFSAVENQNMVLLTWKAENETSVEHYQIERSVNGNDYTSIAQQEIAQASTVPGTCAYTDNVQQVASGVIYYRIKLFDLDGTYQYSKTLTVRKNIDALEIGIFPNPVNEQLNININSAENSQAIVTIWNASGIKVLSQQLNIVNGINSFTIDGIEKLKAGIYQLHVRWPDGKVVTRPFLKQ